MTLRWTAFTVSGVFAVVPVVGLVLGWWTVAGAFVATAASLIVSFSTERWSR